MDVQDISLQGTFDSSSLSGDVTLSAFLCLPSDIGPIIKGRICSQTFQNGTGVQESKQEVTKNVSLVKTADTLSAYNMIKFCSVSLLISDISYNFFDLHWQDT